MNSAGSKLETAMPWTSDPLRSRNEGVLLMPARWASAADWRSSGIDSGVFEAATTALPETPEPRAMLRRKSSVT